MKRFIWLILGVGLLWGILAVIKVSSKNNDGFSYEEIAVKNPSEVTKVLLTDKDGNSVKLSKEEDVWMVNNSIPAFKPHIDILLNKTINKLDVVGPVPEAAKEGLIRRMVGESIHVEIFNKDKKLSGYYVGGSNPDQTGTYFHIEGSDVPYVVNIPGFRGLLTPKFSTSLEDWYSKTIFDYEPEEIEWISLVYHNEKNQNFRLLIKDSTYMLHPGNKINQQAAKSYFALYKFKNFEGYAPYLDQATKDSIKASQPFLTITVKPYEYSERELKLFKKGGLVSGRSLYDKKGDAIVEDVERYFAAYTGFDRLVTVQDYTIGKLLVKRDYFTIPSE